MSVGDRALWLLGLTLLGAVEVWGGEAGSPFASCQTHWTASPESAETFRCFYQVAQEQSLLDGGARRLHELRRHQPQNPWLLFYLGTIELLRGREESEALFRSAAAGFLEGDESLWAAKARLNLSNVLRRQGRLREAGQELAAAGRLAADAGDSMLLAHVRIQQAHQMLDEGRELERAYRWLMEVQQDVFPDGSESLQLACLRALGLVSYDLGRHHEALSYYERRAEMLAARGDFYKQASTRFNTAVTLLELWPREANREEILAQARETLTQARVAGNGPVEVKAALQVGKLLGGRSGRQHLERCLAMARQLRLPRETGYCLSALATDLAPKEPMEANRLIDEAIALGLDAEDQAPWSLVYNGLARMRVRWATRPRHEAISDSLAVLDAIESLRRLQDADAGRASLFSIWTKAYYWLSGRLLAVPGGPSRQELELAFSVSERMRARVLLETLDKAGASRQQASDPHAAELSHALDAIARVQLRLLDPRLSEEQRSEALHQLGELERHEAGLREELARASPRLKSAVRNFVELAQVEDSLAENEALLAFQIALSRDVYGAPAGGSWLTVSTRDDTRAYRLPGREELEPAVEMFLGLFESGAGPEAVPATAFRLYRDLLQPALNKLPAGVERLVLIADGVLHHLPFGALRPSAGDEPLARRYRLSRAPSATLWQRWRGAAPPPAAPAPALVLADPERGGCPQTTATERFSAFTLGAELGALPHARREGRAAVRHLGGEPSRLLAGWDASEHALKHQDLRRFRMLHFAAHALIDDQHPQRSAVVLARGSEAEDGLLQPREIAGLALTGKVVVLSACDSAAGQVLRGEGVMSLARAFFQAGARTVVGGLWRLRDDEAKRLFESFYRHLGDGASVAEALQAAQGDRIRAGAPATAWSGVVVLGDGDVVVMPGGRRQSLPAGSLPALALVAAVLLLLAAGSARRRMARPR